MLWGPKPSSCPSCGGAVKDIGNAFRCEVCGHQRLKAKYEGLTDAQKALAMQAESRAEIAKVEARRKYYWP
jgi:tRNA(Ile2) C34 agmatinyltransferase TiaS